MLAKLHVVASRARHSALLRGFEPVFRRIEPFWNAVLGRASARTGFLTRVNDDQFRLTYEYGSRYDKQRVYEPDIYLPYAASVGSGMTVLDIGAHVGFFALAAAHRVGPQGKVVAFEPSPDTVRILRRHVALNGWEDRVTVAPVVVSDQPGTMTFYTFRDSMAASVSRANVEVLNVQRPDQATAVTVPSVTVDEYCGQRGLQPNVIKIDVEGAELRVLKGAERTLRAHPVTIWCEIHPMQMQNVGDRVEDLYEFAASLGYTVEPIAAPGHMGIYPSRIARQQS